MYVQHCFLCRMIKPSKSDLACCNFCKLDLVFSKNTNKYLIIVKIDASGLNKFKIEFEVSVTKYHKSMSTVRKYKYGLSKYGICCNR